MFGSHFTQAPEDVLIKEDRESFLVNSYQKKKHRKRGLSILIKHECEAVRKVLCSSTLWLKTVKLHKV